MPTTRRSPPSIIGSDLRVIGDLNSEGEVQIDGQVDGDIRSNSLLIGESAQIKGEIVADTVVVHGTVHGQIKAKSVTLARTARMVGDILHEKLAIEQGAYLEGHCRHIETVKKDAAEGKLNLVKDAAPAPSAAAKPVEGKKATG